MRLSIPLFLKFFLPALLGVLASGALYQALVLNNWEHDRVHWGLEVAASAGSSARAEIESHLKLRLSEAQRLAQLARRQKTAQLFEAASLEFSREVLNITLYDPTKDGRYEVHTTTNWPLLTELELPRNTPFLIDQAAPLDIPDVAQTYPTTLLNRSFLHADRPVGVQTYIAYGTALDGSPKRPLLVVDMWAEALTRSLERSERVEVFLVNNAGHLVAHPRMDAMARSVDTPFKGFPLSQLPADWRKGARFLWNRDTQPTVAWVTPSAIPGVLVTAQLPKRKLDASMTALYPYFWKATGAVLGALLLISVWMGARMGRNIRNAQATLEVMAEGNWKAVPRIRSHDDFQSLGAGFAQFAPVLENTLRKEFERGQEDMRLAIAQSARALMASPAQNLFETWGMTTHRPQNAPAYQDFWDFHAQGNRRQFILGRANTDGVSGVLLSVVIRTTLENARKFAGQGSPPRTLGILECVELANETLFQIFKGRVTLAACAAELDLDTGQILWIQAGGPMPLHWRSGAEGNLDQQPGFCAQQPAIGVAANTRFVVAPTLLEPGDRLFVRADIPSQKDSITDPFQWGLMDCLTAHGVKPLNDLKAAIVDKLSRRIEQNALSFLLLERPSPKKTAAKPQPAPNPGPVEPGLQDSPLKAA